MHPERWNYFIGNVTVQWWIYDCFSQGFRWLTDQSTLPNWDMIFLFCIYGIWNRQNAWVFSEDEVSSEGIVS